jgi:hypothetical protein
MKINLASIRSGQARKKKGGGEGGGGEGGAEQIRWGEGEGRSRTKNRTNAGGKGWGGGLERQNRTYCRQGCGVSVGDLPPRRGAGVGGNQGAGKLDDSVALVIVVEAWLRNRVGLPKMLHSAKVSQPLGANISRAFP